MKFRYAICLCLYISTSLAYAQQSITPHELLTMSYISSQSITNDGSKVLYLVSHFDQKSDQYKKHLYWYNTVTGKTAQLSDGKLAVSSPRWSQDGKNIYFISSANSKSVKSKTHKNHSQIHSINLKGATHKITQHTNQDILNFKLSSSGEHIYYLTKKTTHDTDPWAKLRKKHSGIEYGHGKRRTHQIHRFNVKTSKTETLYDAGYVIWDFAVSPDESKIALITTSDNELIHYEGWSDVQILNLKSQQQLTVPDQLFREQAPSPYGYLNGLAWSADSNQLAFGIGYDGHSSSIFITRFNRDTISSIFPILFPESISISTSGFTWSGTEQKFCFLAERKARQQLYCSNTPEANKPLDIQAITPDNNNLRTYAFDAKGTTLVFLQAGLNYYRDLFIKQLNQPSSEKRITEINPQMRSWAIPNIEIVKWTSPDGTNIEGILETPQDYQTSQGPLPLLVSLHGGPNLSDKLAFTGGTVFDGGRTLFSSRGWAVLAVNYRGSTGYGKPFLNDLIGRENDIEVQDILSGVQHLIDHGIADKDKMGIMGWSNGGSLTSWIITQTNQFKAASVGAGVFDKTMQWIIEDTPGHVYNYIGNFFPWEKFKELHLGSTISAAYKIRTPTLIHAGGDDPRVPPEHSKGLYRVLKQYSDTPVELLIYPNEPHGINQLAHKRAKLEWEIRWFDHYVLGKPIDLLSTGD